MKNTLTKAHTKNIKRKAHIKTKHIKINKETNTHIKNAKKENKQNEQKHIKTTTTTAQNNKPTENPSEKNK